MLNTLRKIVQEVNSAKDLKAALGIIVQRVKEAMGTQVCSVYLLDTETQRFVLMATEGLNKRSIGKVSMAPSEGLVGLVGTREEPLNLENAAAHPRYRYFAETGEERYASFLGAPIIHHRRVMGVLVVQQKERRQFDEGEEAFLVTMSAQLAGVIAHAEATGSIRGLGKLGKGIQEAKFVGVPGAPGVGVGKAVVVLPPADLEVVPGRHRRRDRPVQAGPGGRSRRHARAVEQARQPAAQGRTRAVRRLPDDARRCLHRQRGQAHHPYRPVGPGRPAPGGDGARAALRADGRRLSPRARLRRQGHRSPPARLPPGRTQAEPDLPGTDHHRQRGAVAGDARRGAGRAPGRPGLGARLGQLARGDPRPCHGHPHGDGGGRPAVLQGRRYRPDRRWLPRRGLHQPLRRAGAPVQRRGRRGARAEQGPGGPARAALRDPRRPPHAALGQHRPARRCRPRPGAWRRGRGPVPHRSAVHDQ
ncbi:Phosphocarrier protein kinase/phosphorylase, nitrogen regulation associated [Pseudomonas aeruginosa C-NN2]|nr:Phosphocarrier protein kinase/phosphorylase, nitrogen regulation associated [Pseudomonas aeruginosa C-NN2]